MFLRTAFVLALAALAACAPPPGTERLSAGRTVDIASAGTQLSVQRAGAGIIRPLAQSPALQAVAQAHADDLARTGTFSHQGSNGSTLTDRIAASRYNACAFAENIARGTPDIRTTVSEWMNSPGHRENILNAQLTQFGFAEGPGSIWVLVMARPC